MTAVQTVLPSLFSTTADLTGDSSDLLIFLKTLHYQALFKHYSSSQALVGWPIWILLSSNMPSGPHPRYTHPHLTLLRGSLCYQTESLFPLVRVPERQALPFPRSGEIYGGLPRYWADTIYSGLHGLTWCDWPSPTTGQNGAWFSALSYQDTLLLYWQDAL